MNEIVRPESLVLARRRFTSSEVDRTIEIGLIDPDERIELIHGEIVDKGKEGRPHWSARALLVNWIAVGSRPRFCSLPTAPSALRRMRARA